ncbi:MAG: imidazolonepropionase [Nitrospinaceae bacterium]
MTTLSLKDVTVFRNIGQLVQVDASSLPGVRERRGAALLVKAGRVLRVMREADLKSRDKYKAVVDMGGKAVIPGFVDCHTHLIYAGARKKEMEARADGASYLDLHQAGGGIFRTVRATRAASEEDLYQSARRRVRRMMALGATAFEIKTGYGLDLPTELKMLRVGMRLKKALPAPITLTFLAAHAIPEGVDREAYLDEVIAWLPKVRDMAEGVDIFCEDGVFTVHDLRKLFLQAKLLGFDLRAHVEELSHQGGCFEAARLGALSCDHLEHANIRDIRTLREHRGAAVLLPGVTLFLNGEKRPLVHAMLDAGVTIALATDHNPGSSPTYNMQTVLSLAAGLYRLSPAQALAAGTLGGAIALGREDAFGGLLPKQRADFLQLKTGDYRDLFYYFGENLVERTYVNGRPVRGDKGPAVD